MNNKISVDRFSSDNSYQPWLEEKGWKNSRISSNALTLFYVALFFAVFWNAISFPVAFFAISDVYHDWQIDRPDPVFFVLIFPVVGIGLLFWCYRVYRQWAAFGRLTLTLDPYPGSIGGEVGGYLELPLNWRSDYDFEVTVNCIHHSISRSGKNSRHRQDVVWKNFAAVDYEPSGRGIRLKFKCPVDEGLYESEPETGRSYYRWIVHLQGLVPNTAINLDRQFDIPVFKLDEPKRSKLHIHSSAPEIAIEQIGAEQVQIRQHTRSLELDYPPVRNAVMGRGLLLGAMIFLAVTGFLFYETWAELQNSRSFSLFSFGITGMMSFVFGSVSVLMLAFAVHLLSHRLQVFIDANGIKIHSRSWLYNSKKNAQLSEIKSIDKKSTMSSGEGVSATRYFTVTANLHNNQQLTLGSGIKGQLVADSILNLINQQLEHSPVQSSPFDSDMHSSLSFDSDMARKTVKYFKIIKYIVNAIGFIIIIFFFLQFFSLWNS